MAIRVAVAVVLAATVSPAICQQRGGNPLEPIRFPLNPVRDGRLPPPMPQGEASYELKLIKSGTFEQDGNIVRGTDLEFEYRGYAAKCAEAVGDLDSSIFELRGGVDLVGADVVVRGDRVVVDFKNRTFAAVDGDVDLRPSLLQGRVLSDVYVEAASVSGGDVRVDATKCMLTTCSNPEHPHYQLESESLTAIPNQRLIFRDLRLRINGKTFLSIPRFQIPLNESGRAYIPEVGNSADEGYYARFKLPIGSGQDSLVARTDLRSKLGTGFGLDFNYSSTRTRGYLHVYTDVDRIQDGGFTASAQHRQEFTFGSVEVNHETTKFNFLSGPSTISHNTRMQFLLNQVGAGRSRISFTRNEVISDLSRSSGLNVTVSDDRTWSPNHRSSLNITYGENDSRSGSFDASRKYVDLRFRDSVEFPRFNAQLEFNRLIPIGSTVNISSGLDRMPELSLFTDKRRLFGERSWLPDFQALVQLGDYFEGFSKTRVGRYLLDLSMAKAGFSGRGFGVDYSLGFKQGFYSDGTAAYTPRADIRVAYSDGGALTANLRYNYLRQEGFSPLLFDRAGRYNNASFDLLANLKGGLKIGGQVGYDFLHDDLPGGSWVTPSVRLEYAPTQNFRFRGLANYNPDAKDWGNIRLDATAKLGDARIGMAARYDGRRDVWGNFNMLIDGLQLGKVKLSSLLLYNGYLQRFDSIHLSVTYDLHCTEAVFQMIENNTGFRPGREFVFLLRIKALPSDSGFGMGRLGQPLGLGSGRDF